MIGISACLLGIPCRYNAKGLTHSYVKHIKEPVISFCPEIMAGFDAPRSPCEIIGGTGLDVLAGNGKIVNAFGDNITAKMITGAQAALKLCIENGVKQVVLQQGSPTCGCGWIYDGSFSGKTIEGDGIFAALCKKNNIKCIPIRGEKV